MNNRLFDTKNNASNQSVSNEDVNFLRESIQKMMNWQMSLQESADDLSYVANKQGTPYLAPEVLDEIKSLENQLNCNQRRMDTVIKIQNNESINQPEQQFLLMIEVFRNTIVSRYPHVLEQEQTAKPSC